MDGPLQTDREDFRGNASYVPFNVKVFVDYHAMAQVVDDDFVAISVQIFGDADHAEWHYYELVRGLA
jgi:hypothetical protein